MEIASIYKVLVDPRLKIIYEVLVGLRHLRNNEIYPLCTKEVLVASELYYLLIPL